MALSQKQLAQKQPVMQTNTPEPDFFIHSRCCPACGGKHAHSSMQAEAPAETLQPDGIANSWRGFFNKSCFFTYFRCDGCGHLFSPTYLSDSALGQLYGSMENNMHSGDEVLSYLTQESYVQEIVRRTQRAKRYLEIGPDMGLFAKALQKQMKVDTAYLAEPNRAVWEPLRASFPAGTATIVPNVFDLDKTIEDGSLDLAVGIHVLDHITEPSKTVSWVARKLAPGGVAAFVVHNERSLLAKVLGRKWPAYCLQHPQLYNPSTLPTLLQQNGLSDVTVCHTVNYFPFDYLVSHGLFAVTGYKPSLSLPAWPLKLKLGNIMAIAVKKA